MNSRPYSWRKVALLLVFGAIAVLSIYRLSAWVRLRLELAKLAAQGAPLSEADLNTWYEPIPPDENAALIVLKASEARLKLSGKDESELSKLTDSFEPGMPIPPGALSIVEPYVRQNAKAIETLRPLENYDRSRYPVDFSRGRFAPMQHVSEVVQLVKLLRWQALLATEVGEIDAAVQSIVNGFALAATLRHEPVLVSQHMRRASIGILLGATEHILSRGPLTDRQLVQLNALLAKAAEDDQKTLVHSFIGEQAIYVPVFRSTVRTWEGFERDPSMREDPHSLDPKRSKNGEFVDSLIYFCRALSGECDRDLAFYLRSTIDLAQGLALEFPQKRIVTDEIEARVQKTLDARPKRLLVSRLVFPLMTTIARGESFWLARLRCAQTVLAAERYRLRHGDALPPEIDSLIPDYLSELPRDPFDGSPLTLQAHSPRAYSVRADASTEGKRNTGYHHPKYKRVEKPIEFKVLR